MCSDISPSDLVQLLIYDEDSGDLYWRERPEVMFASVWAKNVWNSQNAGRAALNCVDGRGYLHGGLLGKKYRAHRVIWALCNGKWPEGEIDHINGDRLDNRISNLRDVPSSENKRNARKRADNTSGVTGVRLHKASGKWLAEIQANKRRISLGYFDDIEDAIKARKNAEREYGFHPNHGRM